MLRASTGFLRAGANAAKWQQCMKLSTTKLNNFSAAAATPEPQTNPPILYTGVRISDYHTNTVVKHLTFEF